MNAMIKELRDIVNSGYAKGDPTQLFSYYIPSLHGHSHPRGAGQQGDDSADKN
jgi:hypothetical protein